MAMVVIVVCSTTDLGNVVLCDRAYLQKCLHLRVTVSGGVLFAQESVTLPGGYYARKWWIRGRPAEGHVRPGAKRADCTKRYCRGRPLSNCAHLPMTQSDSYSR